MKLQRELAIDALELDLGNRPAHTQNLVVIAFCVRGQNEPFFRSKMQTSGGREVEWFAPTENFRDSLQLLP
jgi:hypothetical protein